MSYISLSKKDKEAMLKKIGASSIEDLFQSIPEEIRLKGGLDIPGPFAESELLEYFEEKAGKNTDSSFLSFLGGGAYRHMIPAVVDYLSQRGEFLTPYTPYQPEVSQGTLQVIFEFQTLICQLTGMDISNASLYDGASGAAESILMANRLNEKPKIVVARTLHPHYLQAIETYTRNLNCVVEMAPHNEAGKLDLDKLKEQLDEETSVVVCQSPNFLGVIEDLKAVSDMAHGAGALSVVVVAEPVSLGILEPPGKLGADIITGEAQSFGIPLSFGGPYLGFMACKKEFVRQFPGRIAGEARDGEENRGFVLTLSTREQHIRRERATSNICTNQAWCALRATIFLETLGKNGLREMAWQNVQKSHYLLEKLSSIKGVKRKFKTASFNEFVLEFSEPWPQIDKHLRKKGILGGLSLEELYPELTNSVLFCVTELHKEEDLDYFTESLKEAFGLSRKSRKGRG